jgi:hypothetical protein
MTLEELVAHLREVHGEPLEAPSPERLAEMASAIHDAMHNERHYAGHFHSRDEVLQLWTSTDRIRQVDTHGRT